MGLLSLARVVILTTSGTWVAGVEPSDLRVLLDRTENKRKDERGIWYLDWSHVEPQVLPRPVRTAINHARALV